jgi:predicted Rdx family selenoprotein
MTMTTEQRDALVKEAVRCEQFIARMEVRLPALEQSSDYIVTSKHGFCLQFSKDFSDVTVVPITEATRFTSAAKARDIAARSRDGNGDAAIAKPVAQAVREAIAGQRELLSDLNRALDRKQ